MTMRFLCLVLVILTFTADVYSRPQPAEGQQSPERLTFGACGISFAAPENWFVVKNEQLVKERTAKLDMSKENLREWLARAKGTLSVVSYYQHDPKTPPAGVIPTISVVARPNPDRAFPEFRKWTEVEATNLGRIFRGYVLKRKVSELSLSGRPALSFDIEFDLEAKVSGSFTVASTIYAIPCGDLFLQISMSEGTPQVSREVFAAFIDSIRFEGKE